MRLEIHIEYSVSSIHIHNSCEYHIECKRKWGAAKRRQQQNWMNHLFRRFVMFSCMQEQFGIRIDIFSVLVQKLKNPSRKTMKTQKICERLFRFVAKTPMMITRSLVLHKTNSIDMMIWSRSLPPSVPPTSLFLFFSLYPLPFTSYGRNRATM